ncbi:hypothetical protein [Hyphomonas johnsonii]|jgi:hypothetical protein|uniref:Lipoprotein n=1 Tax=Hyphomonas johnsonii MHS-2 TaxID=1280950 RepID=A0A059FNE8_9PROT|nr:hypothetical protein [Hyphomonas johnsonii]KCZ92169.1 hypothetical protein HJO_09044 [Hyphomonas johnsonii MHS-2]
MLQSNLTRRRLAPLGALAAGVLLAACAPSRAPGVYLDQQAATPPPPVVAPVDPEALALAELETNELGGIIPDAKPVIPIENGALGEVEPQ